jgi:hypothetical protein
MKRHPYLRQSASSDRIERGWATHPAGSFGGVGCDIVYDPRRHDIVRALASLPLGIARALAAAGWTRHAMLDGGRELWVRNRPTSTRAQLAGLRCVPTPQGRGR